MEHPRTGKGFVSAERLSYVILPGPPGDAGRLRLPLPPRSVRRSNQVPGVWAVSDQKISPYDATNSSSCTPRITGPLSGWRPCSCGTLPPPRKWSRTRSSRCTQAGTGLRTPTRRSPTSGRPWSTGHVPYHGGAVSGGGLLDPGRALPAGTAAAEPAVRGCPGKPSGSVSGSAIRYLYRREPNDGPGNWRYMLSRGFCHCL